MTGLKKKQFPTDSKFWDKLPAQLSSKESKFANAICARNYHRQTGKPYNEYSCMSSHDSQRLFRDDGHVVFFELCIVGSMQSCENEQMISVISAAFCHITVCIAFRHIRAASFCICFVLRHYLRQCHGWTRTSVRNVIRKSSMDGPPGHGRSCAWPMTRMTRKELATKLPVPYALFTTTKSKASLRRGLCRVLLAANVSSTH